MGKGILLEMGGREAVVLTPQGEFRKVPVPRGTWEIGDEIDFAETPQQSYWHKWGLAAAAAAIMLLAPIGYAGFQQYTLRMPAAIVTMDINPSLELTLNKADDVLSARGLNTDGTALLQRIDTKGRPSLDEVVQEVTQAAVDMNKLDPADPSSAVLVAVAPTGAKELAAGKAESIRDKAKQAVAAQVSHVAKAKGAEPKTNVAGVVVTPEEKKAADAAGLSPGKYVFYEELRQVVPDLKLDDVKNAGPGKLLKNLNINAGEFFGQSVEKHGAGDQSKNKSERKSEDKTQQQAVPAGGKANEKQPGKSENPGKGNDKQDQKQEDKGNAPAEPKKDEKQPDQKHSNTVQPQENKGNGNGNGNGNANDKKSEPGNKGDSKKTESPAQKENGNEKKSSWTIPFLGITIEKPAFLQGKDNTKTEPDTSVVTTPRADQPGAGAPSDKQSDPQQQQPEQKQPEQKQPDPKDQGNKDTGNNDQGNKDNGNKDQGNKDNGNKDNGNKDNGNKDQGNKDSGKSTGKDKGH